MQNQAVDHTCRALCLEPKKTVSPALTQELIEGEGRTAGRVVSLRLTQKGAGWASLDGGPSMGRCGYPVGEAVGLTPP